MNLTTIQDRLTEKAKSDAATFLNQEFSKLFRAIPVADAPTGNLLGLKKAIENYPNQCLSLEYIFREIRHAILPEVQTIYINKASREFIEKVEAVQTQLEEIQSQLP